MNPYQPQQPDEGYSEDPLTGPGSSSFSAKSVSHNEGIALLQAHFGSELSPLLAQHISSLSLPSKIQLTESLLEGLPTCVVAEIVQKLSPRLYIDFIRYLPAEICLKILEYLDPLSLLSVAKSCRAWYGLALDRKLWERLYYLEGWKIVASKLQAWEENINRDRPIPSAGGHALKKRAISATRRADSDLDHIMVDADRPVRTDVTESAARSQSDMFGAAVAPAAAAKSKGKERATPSYHSPYLSPPTPSMDDAAQFFNPDRLSKSSLWSWDPTSSRYRINWKYLYSLRRRLEANWEQGKFTNFQFPHPDHPEDAHNEGIYIIQFSSDYLVSGSRDCTIRIWNMHTRRLVRSPLTGHRGSVLCLQFDADPEEDLIISGSSDSNVIIWRFSTGKILQRLNHAHQEPVLNVKFDKRILVTSSKDRTIKIFNRKELRPGDLGYNSTLVDPVPIHLKDYGNDGLDQLPIIPPYTVIGKLEGHSAAVNAVQIHDREVVSASGDRNVKIWDWPNQTCTRTFLGHNKGIACVQYDGRRIVSGSSDNVIKVFDSHSGVEVASLRSHSHLVRTVQAGFGDLPYSIEEDAKAAAKIDEQYYKAARDGTLATNTYRRRHRNNEGGSGEHPAENMLFAGAKLPPGGGGGKYGRIVSGSYDTTVIIWRRDKEGVWKAQHHLKQEEAAAAAAAAGRAAGRAARRQLGETAAQDSHSAAQAAAQAAVQAALQATAEPSPAVVVPAAQSQLSRVPVPGVSASSGPFETHGSTAEGTAAASAEAVPEALQQEFVDGLIAQGAHALQHALVTTPALLSYHALLHASIDRQPSPFVRSQLRQAVSTAVVRAQWNSRQNRRRAAATPAGNAVGEAAGPSGSSGPSGPAQFAPGISASVFGSGSTTGAAGVLPSPFDAAPAMVAPAALAMAVAESLPSLPSVSQGHMQVPSASQSAMEAVTSHGAPPPAANIPSAAAAVTPPAAAVPDAGHIAAGAEAPAAARPQHVHVTDASNPPRIYKLQFDARRIICCSQSSVIVGWDFCNGDAELEEAARFFGTVD